MNCKQIVNMRRDNRVDIVGIYYNKEETHVESAVEVNGWILRLVNLSLGSMCDFIFRGRV